MAARCVLLGPTVAGRAECAEVSPSDAGAEQNTTPGALQGIAAREVLLGRGSDSVGVAA